MNRRPGFLGSTNYWFGNVNYGEFGRRSGRRRRRRRRREARNLAKQHAPKVVVLLEGKPAKDHQRIIQEYIRKNIPQTMTNQYINSEIQQRVRNLLRQRPKLKKAKRVTPPKPPVRKPQPKPKPKAPGIDPKVAACIRNARSLVSRGMVTMARFPQGIRAHCEGKTRVVRQTAAPLRLY